MNDNKYGKKPYRGNNSAPRPRNEEYTIDLSTFFESTRGDELNASEIESRLNELDTNGTFKSISIPVRISRTMFMNDSSKNGFMNIGYIRGIDVINHTVDITIYSSSVDVFKTMLDRVCLAPRIMANRGEFITFLTFDIEGVN